MARKKMTKATKDKLRAAVKKATSKRKVPKGKVVSGVSGYRWVKG